MSDNLSMNCRHIHAQADADDQMQHWQTAGSFKVQVHIRRWVSVYIITITYLPRQVIYCKASLTKLLSSYILFHIPPL